MSRLICDFSRRSQSESCYFWQRYVHQHYIDSFLFFQPRSKDSRKPRNDDHDHDRDPEPRGEKEKNPLPPDASPLDESLSQAIETRDAAASKRAATEKQFQDLELALQQAQAEEEAADDFARRSLEIQQELKAIKARAKVPVPDPVSDHDALPPVQSSSSPAALPRSEDLTRLVSDIVSKTVSFFLKMTMVILRRKYQTTRMPQSTPSIHVWNGITSSGTANVWILDAPLSESLLIKKLIRGVRSLKSSNFELG